mmetsp:Transcript_74004/g.173589  ORF Transcript_74004/g.173589 Transcript_74004/m.173589 type:complete len:238 (+) Transcript_74004:758-1471(+)
MARLALEEAWSAFSAAARRRACRSPRCIRSFRCRSRASNSACRPMMVSSRSCRRCVKAIMMSRCFKRSCLYRPTCALSSSTAASSLAADTLEARLPARSVRNGAIDSKGRPCRSNNSGRSDPMLLLTSWLRSASSLRRRRISASYLLVKVLGSRSSFTCGVVTTPFARWANFRVDKDSAKASAAGETMAIIVVRQFPPRESSSNLVNFESRYGTWGRQTGPRCSVSAEITLPRADRL